MIPGISHLYSFERQIVLNSIHEAVCWSSSIYCHIVISDKHCAYNDIETIVKNRNFLDNLNQIIIDGNTSAYLDKFVTSLKIINKLNDKADLLFTSDFIEELT